ncbi:MAG: tRNA lysidine(34) synthetase TilS [Candidatus Marinimicrobia bacterium]|nr:tRNA lysidine(34) synthetase TilS [Candidatus Neomarinimicrobiota bacterium]MCF7921396.1 tRNA lysidine(34) synthetase TilS [Candidatus Neomarinimicrobiota bacterium]
MLNDTNFRQYCQSSTWYRPGLKVLVACSGGVDSTVLLHLLKSLPQIQISMVHFDHRLRGIDSDADRAFVEDMALRLGYPVHVISEDIGDYASQNGLSIEEAGSIRRRSQFLALKDQLGLHFVATGQNEDDQIETIFMNLYQGSGISGLMGISEYTNSFIRPILKYSRLEIMEYAENHKLQFRIDKSNSDTSFLRNNIRANFIPGLTQNNDHELKACIQSINQAAQALSDMIKTSIEDIDIKEFNTYSASKIALGMGEVPGYFSPIQKAIFDRAFQLISSRPQGISSSHFKALKSLLGDEAIGKEIHLPAAVTACRHRAGISLYKKSDYCWSRTQLSVSDVGKFPFFSIEYSSSNLEDHIQDPSYFWNVYPLEAYRLRVVEPGDSLVIDATGRSIAINQVLQSARVATYLKEYYPVLEHEGEIQWVPGIRTAFPALVSEKIPQEKELRHCMRVQFQEGTFE